MQHVSKRLLFLALRWANWQYRSSEALACRRSLERNEKISEATSILFDEQVEAAVNQKANQGSTHYQPGFLYFAQSLRAEMEVSEEPARVTQLLKEEMGCAARWNCQE